jgi:hypothetical protein
LDYDTPKAHQTRVVAVPAFLGERLRDHLATEVDESPRPFLFTGRTGHPLRYGSWRRWLFDPAVRAAR